MLSILRKIIGGFAIFVFVLIHHTSYCHASVRTGDYYRVGGAGLSVVGAEQCGNTSRNTLRLDDPGFFRSYSIQSFGKITCSQKDGIENFLKVNELIFEGITVGAMCTGAGASVSVVTGTASLALHMIDLVVTNLECEDPDNDRKIKETAKQVVCEALIKQGLDCDPSRL